MNEPRGATRPKQWDARVDDLLEQLQKRRGLVADDVYAHITATVPDPVGHSRSYDQQLRATVKAMVSYTLDAIRRSPISFDPLPPEAAEQARRAARSGVGIGTVLSRYVAAHVCLSDIIMQEVQRFELTNDGPILLHLRTVQEKLLQHVTLEMNACYPCVPEQGRRSSVDQRRYHAIQRLLAGEPPSPNTIAELNYELDGASHLGIVSSGPGAAASLTQLKARLGRRLLCVTHDTDTTWAWFSGARDLTVSDFRRALATSGIRLAAAAIGEPGCGLEGWRQTHREAEVAQLIAAREPSALTRSADALPIVAALQNAEILTMYETSFLWPLNRLQDGGAPAREVLRGYLKHGRNVSSAANALRISRSTAEHHINEVRNALGEPINLTGLEIALRLEEIGYLATQDEAACASTPSRRWPTTQSA